MADKPLTIVADRSLDQWEQFLLDTLQQMGSITEAAETEVESIACVALLKNGNVASAYQHAECMDLAYMAANLLFDAIDHYISGNFERFMDAYESGEFDLDWEEDESYGEAEETPGAAE